MLRSCNCVAIGLFIIGCQQANSQPVAKPAKPTGNPLVRAAFLGDVKTVKLLLDAGTNVDARYGGPAKDFRGEQGGWSIAGSRWTALHAAASGLHTEVVKALIDAGANLDLDDGYGATALYMSVDVYDRENQKDDCALLLIKAGAKVETKTRVYIDGGGGHTPLHRAVAWNQIRAVKELIKAGADVNARDDSDGTPLHDAYLCKADSKIVDALLKAGADPKAKDKEGREPQYWK